MSITVADILSLPSFKDAACLAGTASLDNTVLQVSIADSPISELDYVVSRKGDFYLSGFYFAKDSLKSMYEFLNTLKITGASGVCLLDEYIKELPGEIIDYCDENHIPVLLVSADIPYSIMIREITELILFDAQNILLTNKISTLMSGTLDDHRKLLLLKEINTHFQNYITSVSIFLPDSAANTVKNAIIDFFNQDISSFAAAYQGALLGFVTYNAFSQKSTDVKMKYYTDSIAAICPGAIIGVSKFDNKLIHADTSIRQAITASEIGRNKKGDPTIVYYNNLGILKLLLLLAGHSELEDFYHEILDPIWDYDQKNNAQLFDTMRIFLEQKRDYKLASKMLFVHENTVRYRVGKVKEMLEAYTDDDFCETFSIALKCKSIGFS